MSLETEGASFPSKYQQIKWIVSRQLISPVPQKTQQRGTAATGKDAFQRPRDARKEDSPKLLIWIEITEDLEEGKQSPQRNNCAACAAKFWPLPRSRYKLTS